MNEKRRNELRFWFGCAGFASMIALFEFAPPELKAMTFFGLVVWFGLVVISAAICAGDK
jgi:hypothetical protein